MLGRGIHQGWRKGRSFAGRLKARAAATVLGFALAAVAVGHTDATPEVLSLRLYNIHTQEQGTFVFKRGGVYDRAGLAALNNFLRDWRKERPTTMDPRLFDLIYQVYRASGSRDFIHVVCGYRSPETNGMLRRRSKGVAENSLHMQGKAMDFFIPDVPLAKLRQIGLQMQTGGVGFYPTSGSPFVHMDVGSPRHWPRMTRQQLVQIFPNGRTLYIPSDGKPLPGYAEALAEYKARKANGAPVATFAVATANIDKPAPKAAVADAAPIQLAAADDAGEDDGIDDTAPVAAPVRAKVAVAAAAYGTGPVPLPNLAPRRNQPAPVVVAAAAPAPAPVNKPTFAVLASVQPRAKTLNPDFDFGSPQDWSSPAVPAALAKAMAERDQLRRGASLPIPPTAVVATIDVSRPLRAEAITTAVLRTSSEPVPTVPRVMAYAAEAEPMPLTGAVVRPKVASITGGIPLPSLRPRAENDTRVAAVRAARPAMEAPDLTMTSLDTQGLRMWMAPASTRQKAYALLTMPDFGQMPDLFAKPTVTFGAGFSQTAYGDLRTDRFSGQLVQQPKMVDLMVEPLIASIR
ncbi:MAG TPA: DUF882 domain-containing protein [Bauldia sp.]|nr:DUF882 domain-containing protein [Bauldia sp.]